jgi:hypothetical protein
MTASSVATMPHTRFPPYYWPKMIQDVERHKKSIFNASNRRNLQTRRLHWCLYQSHVHISPMPTCSNCMNFCRFNFSANVSINHSGCQVGHWTLQIFSNYLQHRSSFILRWLRDTFFCKGRKVMEKILQKSCLGLLYQANAQNMQNQICSGFREDFRTR